MSTSQTSAAAEYIVIGTTNDAETCDRCGETDLKVTVAMCTTDDPEPQYFGTTCAARLAGRPVDAIRSAAKRADTARRETALREQRRRNDDARYAAAAAAGFAPTHEGGNAFTVARSTVRYHRNNPTMIRGNRADVGRRSPHQLGAFDAYLAEHGVTVPGATVQERSR